jgi:hypothetical protein
MGCHGLRFLFGSGQRQARSRHELGEAGSAMTGVAGRRLNRSGQHSGVWVGRHPWRTAGPPTLPREDYMTETRSGPAACAVSIQSSSSAR